MAIRVKGISENQVRYIQSIRYNSFTLAIGHAGSGKTYCAVGMALKYLFMNDSGIDKIIIIRRALAACKDDIGHLPGDAFDKMYPYFGSILDNIEEFIPRQLLRHLVKEEKIEIVPLAFLRGRTLKNCFIIVEEAQNCTIEAMKMILTRVGHDSKIVVTGDVHQRDNVDDTCGLLDATTRFEGCDNFGIVKLYNRDDVVRNEHTNKIIEKYEQDGL
jgi:phosphate starvation-inducible PhoH-like protein